jgi:hypothetical protein
MTVEHTSCRPFLHQGGGVQLWGLIHSPGVDLADSTGQSLKV